LGFPKEDYLEGLCRNCPLIGWNWGSKKKGEIRNSLILVAGYMSPSYLVDEIFDGNQDRRAERIGLRTFGRKGSKYLVINLGP